eukprot:1127832-Amphidinium_carterae.1
MEQNIVLTTKDHPASSKIWKRGHPISIMTEIQKTHLRLKHALLKTYEQLRTEVIIMLLGTNIGDSLQAPEVAAR